MDPKDLTKLTQQEHFLLDAAIYCVFKNATRLDNLARLQVDASHEAIQWVLTNGHRIEVQVTYNHNHQFRSLLNTFMAESLDENHHLQETVDKYVYFTNLMHPFGDNMSCPDGFSKGQPVTKYADALNDDQQAFVKSNFKNSPLKSGTKAFDRFYRYFWKRFMVEQPTFNEDDDVSRSNQLLSQLLKSLQKKYVVGDSDLLSVAKVLKPIQRLLNCNLWANAFDYQHHVYVPGSQIQAILQKDLSGLKQK